MHREYGIPPSPLSVLHACPRTRSLLQAHVCLCAHACTHEHSHATPRRAHRDAVRHASMLPHNKTAACSRIHEGRASTSYWTIRAPLGLYAPALSYAPHPSWPCYCELALLNRLCARILRFALLSVPTVRANQPTAALLRFRYPPLHMRLSSARAVFERAGGAVVSNAKRQSSAELGVYM